MDKQDSTQSVHANRRRAIMGVCRQGLVFAEESAVHVGVDALDDANILVYYLVYVLGAITWFGDQVTDGGALEDGEKLAAMAEALAAFESSEPAEIRTTVLALASARSPASMALHMAGREAAKTWQSGDRQSASRRFKDLMSTPANIPLPLEPALAAIARPSDVAPEPGPG